jgi:hypothetical protein
MNITSNVSVSWETLRWQRQRVASERLPYRLPSVKIACPVAFRLADLTARVDERAKSNTGRCSCSCSWACRVGGALCMAHLQDTQDNGGVAIDRSRSVVPGPSRAAHSSDKPGMETGK